jgi:hypothetical protein
MFESSNNMSVLLKIAAPIAGMLMEFHDSFIIIKYSIGFGALDIYGFYSQYRSFVTTII